MGSFLVYHKDARTAIVTGQYVPENLAFSLRNSEPGTISYEIPLSEPFLTKDQFAPYRTDWYLYRAGTGPGGYDLIEAGIMTDVNLSGDRDSVLVTGKSMLHYLERRTYPFDPVAYVTDHDWVSWPKQWPTAQGDAGTDLTTIVQAILQAMLDASPNTLPITFSNVPTGSLGFYKIFPADQTTIFEHIQKLAGMEDGFEFELVPQSLQFKMYSPDRDTFQPVYRFTISGTEADGQVTLADWTNSGPASTYFIGYGAGSKIKKGAISTYLPSEELYRRLDRTEDFGEISSQDMMDRVSASQGYQDRFPQKKLSLSILNPEFLATNFYTAGRPRSLIGQRVHFTFDFINYHKVDADYRVIALNWDVDEGTNEIVEWELEMVNDANTTGSEGTGFFGSLG